jgi:hypothetical protein
MQRKYLTRAGLLFVGLGALMAGISYWTAKAPEGQDEAQISIPPPSEVSAPVASDEATENLPSAEVSSDGISSQSQLTGIDRPALVPQGEVAEAGPEPQASELIASLARPEIKDGKITRQKADEWRQCLQALIGQGEDCHPDHPRVPGKT